MYLVHYIFRAAGRHLPTYIESPIEINHYYR